MTYQEYKEASRYALASLGFENKSVESALVRIRQLCEMDETEAHTIRMWLYFKIVGDLVRNVSQEMLFDIACECYEKMHVTGDDLAVTLVGYKGKQIKVTCKYLYQEIKDWFTLK